MKRFSNGALSQWVHYISFFNPHLCIYISQKRIRRAYSEFATLFKIYIYIYFNVCTIIRENDIRIFFKGIHWEMINTLVKLPVFHSEQKKRIDKNGETFSLKFHYFIVDFAAETFELYFLISMFWLLFSVRKKVNWVS